jgi:hypothetical protein
MHTPQKATAALALLALGWIGAAATPAFADQHGVANKAAAYQAEGLGTTTGRVRPEHRPGAHRHDRCPPRRHRTS